MPRRQPSWRGYFSVRNLELSPSVKTDNLSETPRLLHLNLAVSSRFRHTNGLAILKHVYTKVPLPRLLPSVLPHPGGCPRLRRGGGLGLEVAGLVLLLSPLSSSFSTPSARSCLALEVVLTFAALGPGLVEVDMVAANVLALNAGLQVACNGLGLGLVEVAMVVSDALALVPPWRLSLQPSALVPAWWMSPESSPMSSPLSSAFKLPSMALVLAWWRSAWWK